MAKIQQSPERTAIILRTTADWLAAGLSCAPADFDATELAVARLYERIGRKRPYFVRLSSPFGAELYINLLTKTWPAMTATGQLAGQLRGQLWDQLRGQLWDQLRGQLWDQLRDQLWDQLAGQLGDQLEDQLRGQLAGQLRGQLWDQLAGKLGGQLRGQLEDQLRGQLRGQLRDQLRDQLGGQLWDQLRGQNLKYIGTSFWGAWDAYLWGFYDAGRQLGVIYDQQNNDALNDHCVITRNCGWIYPFADFCILTDRPSQILRDDRNRLHSENDAALLYRDGYGIWAHHGVRVPSWVIDTPSNITAAKIESEENQEIRRVMMSRYRLGEDVFGAAAYLRDAGGEIVDHDDKWGTLRCKHRHGDSDVMIVEVVNNTPERDGSFKHYWLRVHPELRPIRAMPDGTMQIGEPQLPTAHNAVASTWGKRGEEFHCSSFRT